MTRHLQLRRSICLLALCGGAVALLGAGSASAAGLAVDATVTTHQASAAKTIVSPAFSTSSSSELVLAFITSDGPSGGGSQTFSSVTGGGLTWRLRRRANTQAGTAEIWSANASSVLSKATVTATRGSGSYLGSITVVTFTGADLIADGATGAASALTGAPTVSLSTTRAGSVVWGVGNDWDRAATRTVGANQTKVDEFLATFGDTFWVQRQSSPIPLGGTNVTLNDTAPTNDRWNMAAIEVLPAVTDSQPPTAPTNLAAGTVTSTQVPLSWSASSDDQGVAGYRVFRGAIQIADVPGTAFTDSTVAASTSYTYTVKAYDAAGNVSPASEPLSVTTPAGDSTPPSVSLVAPAPEAALSGTATLEASASDALFQGDFASGGQQYVLDPQTGTVTHVPDAAADLFCAGQAVLADGRILVVGGTSTSGGLGVPDITAFDWHNEGWNVLAPMHFPRWYATGTTLADGKVLVTSGYDENDKDIVVTPELYSPDSNSWQSLPAANHSMPVYPFIYQLPDGRIAHLGGSEDPTASEVLDLSTNQWTSIDSRVIDGGSIANYAPGRFIKAGSAADDGYSGNSLKTAYTLNMNAPGATWQPTSNMAFPRSFLNLTNLPDGTVLATGGGTDKSGFVDANGVLQAEDWDPSTGAWTTYAAMSKPRLYHSVAVLLPDGRVYVSGGGGDPGVSDQKSAQIFSPPYLFKGPRPTIASAPATVKYGESTFVGTPDAASISRVSLIRTGSVTHAFDQNARATSLSFSQTPGGLNVNMPSNANDVPPGYYMLFLVNGQGVPSVASFVRFPAPYEDTSPPSAPGSLTATGGAGSASLSWGAASDNIGVARYNVHRSSTAGFVPSAANRVGQTAVTSFSDSGLVAGTYYYKVTAEDAAGNVGAPSPEATATVSTGTTPPLALDKTVTTRQSAPAATISSPALSTAGPNELLLAFIGSDGPNATAAQSIASVSGGGLTWTLRRRANGQAGTAEIWQAVAPTVLTNAVITATRASGSYQGAITVAAFTGADTAASGATASGSAASGAPSLSLATTRAGSWVWGVGEDWDKASSRTVGAGQTLVDQFLSPSGDTFWTQRQTATTATAGTTVAISDTAPTADRWDLALVEVLPASGP